MKTADEQAFIDAVNAEMKKCFEHIKLRHDLWDVAGDWIRKMIDDAVTAERARAEKLAGFVDLMVPVVAETWRELQHVLPEEKKAAYVQLLADIDSVMEEFRQAHGERP